MDHIFGINAKDKALWECELKSSKMANITAIKAKRPATAVNDFITPNKIFVLKTFKEAKPWGSK